MLKVGSAGRPFPVLLITSIASFTRELAPPYISSPERAKTLDGIDRKPNMNAADAAAIFIDLCMFLPLFISIDTPAHFVYDTRYSNVGTIMARTSIAIITPDMTCFVFFF